MQRQRQACAVHPPPLSQYALDAVYAKDQGGSHNPLLPSLPPLPPPDAPLTLLLMWPLSQARATA